MYGRRRARTSRSICALVVLAASAVLCALSAVPAAAHQLIRAFPLSETEAPFETPTDDPAATEPGAVPVVLRLATGSDGGTFLPVGHDLAAWLESSIPGLTVVVDTTAGSVENLRRLVGGEADLAIVGSSPFRTVLEETGYLSRGAAGICFVGTLYVDAEQYVIRRSLIRAESMLDLSGVSMYPGPRNSGGEVDTRTVLQTLGVEPRFVYPIERDKSYAEAADALARGEFDASTFSGGVPIDALDRLLADHPGEFAIVPFTRHQLAKVRHAKLDFEPVVIAAGTYPGQDQDIVSVGGPSLLVASPQLGERWIRAIDRAIFLGIVEKGKGLRAPASHPVLQTLTPVLWGRAAIGQRCEGAAVPTAQSNP